MSRTPRQRFEDLVAQAAADPTPVFEVGIPMMLSQEKDCL
jgi:hypothetical protein